MAAVNNINLIQEIEIASSTTTLSEAKSVGNKATELILTSEISERVDGTYTTTLQHSPDGISWFTLDSCSAQSANGMVIKSISTHCFQNLRASILSSGVTDGAKITVKLWFALKD